MTDDLRQRQPREECPAFLAFVRRRPCCACGAPPPSQAAHIRMVSRAYGKRAAGIGEKPSDRWCTPLCSSCHLDGPEAQHKIGEERFWRQVGVDPCSVAAVLYAQFERRRDRSPEQRKAVVSRAKRILKKRRPMMGPGVEAEFVIPDGQPMRKVSRAKDPELYRYRWGGKARKIQGANRFPPKGSRKFGNKESRP